MTLTLLPTIEFEPCDWAEPGYDGLLGTPQWDELWSRSLSRWQVKPIAHGAWHVSIELIQSEDTLMRLLTLSLQGRGVEGFPDEDGKVDEDEERVRAMNGGYALFDAAGNAAALPSCCCDLGDLRAWRRVATIGEGEGLWLDIGHGNWSAHRDGRGISLTENPERMGAEPITTLVSADDLLAATFVAEAALEALRLRLLPVLGRIVGVGARTDSLSRLMVGLPVE